MSLGIPSPAVRDVLLDLRSAIPPNATIVSLAKGFEQGTRLRMTEVIHDVLPENGHAVLTGPNIAAEVGTSRPVAAVVSSPT